MGMRGGLFVGILAASALATGSQAQIAHRLQPSDYQRLRAVVQTELSPDSRQAAYTVLRYDRPGPPWPQSWLMDPRSVQSSRLFAEG